MISRKSVLLDTSFFLRFLNDQDPLFHHADGYFRYFLEHDMPMLISTISIAEYCVGGESKELPLRNLQIIPFNLNHAEKAGEMAKIVFLAKRAGAIELPQRNIIPNDTKLFAQANIDSSIEYYLSSDSESKKVYDLIKQTIQPRFQFLDLRINHREAFGLIDFG